MIWVTSTTFFSQTLVNATDHLLHWPTPYDLSGSLPIKGSEQKAAIVILGGGVRRGAIEIPQYKNQDVSKEAMERLRMGARLAKSLHLPILVTGGSPDRGSIQDLPEGQLMAQVLQEELNSPVKWIEDQSNTTQENASLSAKMLKKENIHQVYLVTHFWHMPRAKYIFERETLQIIPVPLGYQIREKFSPLDFFPNGSGLEFTRQIWHEVLGGVWYRLRFASLS